MEIIESFDRTEIATRATGDGPKVPVLLVSPVGATELAWRRISVDLERERPVVSWDHRGLHDSGPPRSDRLDPGAHAEDAIAVLDHFGIERVAIAAWSNGGRIALEIAHRYPERVTALALACAGSGPSLFRLIRHLEVSSVFPLAAGITKHFARSLEGPFHALVSRPQIAGLIRQSGLVAASADTTALVDLLRGMGRCDLRVLLASYEAVAGDSPADLLPEIHASALVIAGEKDPFAAPRSVEELARRLPAARLSIYEKATHWLPLEFPARLSADLRAFFSP